MADEVKQRLNDLLRKHPYLNNDKHELHTLWKTATDANQVDMIEKKLEAEQKTLRAAFRRFCIDGNDFLQKREVKLMNEYLGFPHTDRDVDGLMKNLDKTSSGKIEFDVFAAFVGSMGGSMKLFEQRRGHMAGGAKLNDIEESKLSLLEAGFTEEAQACWRLVVPRSEFQEVTRLIPCQKSSLAHIRRLAQSSHERALLTVQERISSLGYPDDALWKTLAWIRELAPIVVHIDLDKMLEWLEKDTHYRNQFETGTSGAALDLEARTRWENGLFNGCYSREVQAKDRCKYAVLNVMNDYRGVVKCQVYGTSYLILKDVRLRCTCSPEDSAAMKAESLAVFDFYAHVLQEYSDAELRETLRVAISTDEACLGDSSKVGAMKYKEVQVHGEIRFGMHVERLVADPKHKAQASRIRSVCDKYKWNFSWIDEEKERMQKDGMGKISNDAWAEHLAHLETGLAHLGVPPGFCKVGCGRRVCPGVTRKGNPFSTCCRGCILGFGHDLRCGKLDASKLGAGLCKFGCGRKVNAGWKSCCRGCAKGGDHDSTCRSADQADVRDRDTVEMRWEVETDTGWEPWSPGVAFTGRPSEQIFFSRVVGVSRECGGVSFDYSATFDSLDSGIQTNLSNERKRRLRRVPIPILGT